MDPLKKSALGVIVGGFVMQSVGFGLVGTMDAGEIRHAGGMIHLIGFALFLAGCVFLARAKGREWYFGLLGLLSLVGLGILWFAIADTTKPPPPAEPGK
jgi:hypothetical protein